MNLIFSTLKSKISLTYAGLVFLIALVGFAGFFNLYRLEVAVDSLMTNNYKSINAATQMMESIERQDGAILIYISVDRVKGMKLFMDSHASFIKWYEIEINNVTEQGEKKLVENMSRQYETYVDYFSQLQNINDSQGKDKAIQFYDKTILPHFYTIKQTLSEVSHLNEIAMFHSKEMASAKTRQSMYFLLGLSFTAVIGGLVISRHFTSRFLRPLDQLSESIRKVRAGELNQKLPLQTNDEAGRLAREFNDMMLRLQVYEKSTMGQLLTEKNRSMAIVKSITDPLLVLDTNYRVILINHACGEFFGISESDVAGKHFLQAIHNGEIFDHITEVIHDSSENSDKIFHLRRETDYYFNVAVAAVKDPESKNSGLVVVFQNVTKLKELEKVKTDFVATISHEFKTPLTSIMMAASMLLDNGMGDLNAEQTEVMEALREDGERLNGLVNELLELSRIESGREVYKFIACSVEEIAAASVRGFMDAANRRNVKILNAMPEKLPSVEADFDKISWVLNNLISNALKYTESGDTITILADAGTDSVTVSVRDTGSGIYPEYIEHIFDKFYQANDGQIEARGTGLGLYVAREIVQAHKGGISVSSKPGEGSIFSFTLPVADEEKEQ